MREVVRGIGSISGRYKTDGEVKNSMGNGEAKELTCTTHGHELRGGMMVAGGYRAEGGTGHRGIKGRNGTTVIA